MEGSFLTIKESTTGLFKNKGSKFLAFSYRVKNEDEIREIVKDKRKEFYDARHVCYAFVLGEHGEIFRGSDNGEPANSAGIPILNAIKSLEISNVLVVVVRYFGGTKLGVPGLIEAYKTATEDALSQAELVVEFVTFDIEIQFEYAQMNDAMKVIKEYDLQILSQEMLHSCKMKLEVKKSVFEQVKTTFSDLKFLVEN